MEASQWRRDDGPSHRPTSMRWWAAQAKAVAAAAPTGVQRVLRDDPRRIRDLISKASKWSDIELAAWSEGTL
jgi:hypothetical protein